MLRAEYSFLLITLNSTTQTPSKNFVLYCNIVWKLYLSQGNICLFNFSCNYSCFRKITWVEDNVRPQMWDQWGHTIRITEFDEGMLAALMVRTYLNSHRWLRQCKAYKNSANSTNSVPTRKVNGCLTFHFYNLFFLGECLLPLWWMFTFFRSCQYMSKLPK